MDNQITKIMNTAVSTEKQTTSKRTLSKKEIQQRGWEAFLALRAEAKKNGLTGMTLEEINEEIRLYREGK